MSGEDHMPRKFAYPSGHWSLKVEIPYSMGVRAGDMISPTE